MYLLLFFFITISLKLYFDFKFYLKINHSFKKETKVDSNFKAGISVIICAKNELDNLKRNIPKFVNQEYPIFEIILVNDGSKDNTESYIRQPSLQLKLLILTIIKIYILVKKRLKIRW